MRHFSAVIVLLSAIASIHATELDARTGTKKPVTRPARPVVRPVARPVVVKPAVVKPAVVKPAAKKPLPAAANHPVKQVTSKTAPKPGTKPATVNKKPTVSAHRSWPLARTSSRYN
jgi:hypothetical protein